MEINNEIYAGVHFWINTDFLRYDYDVVLVKQNELAIEKWRLRNLGVDYRFTAVSLKIPMTYFTKILRNPKIHVEPQKTSNSQSNP